MDKKPIMLTTLQQYLRRIQALERAHCDDGTAADPRLSVPHASYRRDPRRHPARRILALAILSGLVAAGAAWGIFVFGPRA